MSEAGLQNSAILLLSLGEEEAASVFRHLAPKEVQKIGKAMATLKSITKDKIEEVLALSHEEAEEQTSIGSDPDAYVRAVITKALGDDKAGFLLDRSLQQGSPNGFESL